MKLCSIASSSSGNCIYIGNDHTNILIDIGISGKKMETGLKAIEIDPKHIDGVLITHEHSDHIKGLGVIARRYKIPIYATEHTINYIRESNSLGKIDEILYNVITPDTVFSINDIMIKAIRISHDAVDPVCYTFIYGEKKISVATDLGTYDAYIVDGLRASNALFLEANHDIKMLEVGSYPYYLKQRIKSDLGHLSNEMSGKLLREVLHDGLEYIILGHLSNENNMDDVAYESVLAELDRNLIDDIAAKLMVANKYEVSKLIKI